MWLTHLTSINNDSFISSQGHKLKVSISCIFFIYFILHAYLVCIMTIYITILALHFILLNKINLYYDRSYTSTVNNDSLIFSMVLVSICWCFDISSSEPLFQTEYFNRCLSEQLHTQNYSWLEQSIATIRSWCNSDTNHGLLQGSCVEASETVICIHVAFNCKFCWYYQFLTRAQWLTLT